ncbi:MAG: acyltransferase [Terracidiphilus sp.]
MGTVSVRAEPPHPAPADPRHAHDIPSLDGLRALSIFIVILSHTKGMLPAGLVNSGLFRYTIGGGLHGVQVFFVLSGYLITTLLLREFNRTGEISLRRFYLRRCLRIFPPFYAYLVVLAILWIIGSVPEDAPSFFAAATYTIVYLPNPLGSPVQHAWSLSIEEQFYLLWPALLLWCHRSRRSLHIALLILAIMPCERILLFFLESHDAIHLMRTLVNTGSIDTLVVGCLLALLRDEPRWQRFHQRFLNVWTAGVMLAVAFVLAPYAGAKLTHGLAGYLAIALGTSVTALSLGGILVYVVENPRSPAGRFLNLGLLRHIGVISYSLYLWQQFFAYNRTLGAGPYAYLFMLLAAEASFWLIEIPALRLRRHLHL